MKKRFLTLLTSAVGIVALSACGSNDINEIINNVLPSEGKYEEFDFRGKGYLDNDYFALKHVLYDVEVGESKQVKVETLPTSYASLSLNYHSTDDAIVRVDDSGNITGVSKGVADIVISSRDGSLSHTVRVVVSEKTSKSNAQTVLNSINDRYNDPSYKAPRRVLRYEYSAELYKCEGVLDHGTESYEAMGFDMDEGYFFIEGPSLYHKTQYGTPELADGKWIFYPINQGVMTRLVHITPTARNYFDINTANYETNERIIRDILNFFFVSGEKIVNDLMEDFDGKAELNDLFGYSATSYYSVNENALHLKYTQHSTNQKVTYDDEINYFDIPTDTVYAQDYNLSLLNHGNRTKAYDIEAFMTYQLADGKNWVREFYRSQLYEEDFERVRIQDPKNNGFKQVDSIYDL